MRYEDFSDEMSDILSSGYGEFSKWHKTLLKDLFLRVGDRKVLVQLLNDYYEDQDIGDAMEGEFSFIAVTIGGSFEYAVTFQLTS